MVAMVGGGTAKGVDWAATIRGISLGREGGSDLGQHVRVSQADS